MILLPIGHEKTITRLPWVTAAIGVLCLLVQVQHTFFAPNELEFVLVDNQLQRLQRADPTPTGDEKALDAYAGKVLGADAVAPASLEELQARRAALRRRDLTLFLGHWYDEGLGTLRLFTCAFAHGSWFHLLGNMLFLYLCGCTLEDRWGRLPFLGFYLGAALLSSLFPTLLHRGEHVLSLGASGAIAACMGAFIVFWGSTRITLFYFIWILRPRWGTFLASAYWAIGVWFALQLLDFVFEASGAAGGVSYSAHVSGFLFGAGTALGMKQLGYDAKIQDKLDEADGNWKEDDAVAGALALMHQGDEPGALMRLKELRRSQPRNETVRHELYELGMRLQDREAVEATLPDVLVELARRGEGRTVLERYRRVTGIWPDLALTDRALAQSARCAFDMEENQLGVELTTRLMKGFPQSPVLPGALVEVAKAQQRAGKPEQARRTLEHVISKFPLDPFAREARRLLTAAAGPAAPKSA